MFIKKNETRKQQDISLLNKTGSAKIWHWTSFVPKEQQHKSW